MAGKSPSDDTKSTPDAPLSAITQLQEAGLGSMVGMGTAWLEAVSDMSAEVAHFIAERIKEDVKTQHEILHCKNVADLQSIQAEFIQTAVDQYQAETGKLVEMGTKAFAPKES
ncbi:phasin family protein [uncultured Tateyamaria sp.]|uniref:phasin family protein n=1 Tax=Tateyamaria sp. 1078 TaxID=3417464 RepID=UPI002638C602|nr:phasin family protein [uncultured Tateyamaria sp.]